MELTDEMYVDLNFLLEDFKFKHKNNVQLAEVLNKKHKGLKAEHVHLMKEHISQCFQEDLEVSQRWELGRITENEEILDYFNINNDLIPTI